MVNKGTDSPKGVSGGKVGRESSNEEDRKSERNKIRGVKLLLIYVGAGKLP